MGACPSLGSSESPEQGPWGQDRGYPSGFRKLKEPRDWEEGCGQSSGSARGSASQDGLNETLFPHSWGHSASPSLTTIISARPRGCWFIRPHTQQRLITCCLWHLLGYDLMAACENVEHRSADESMHTGMKESRCASVSRMYTCA